MFVVGAISDIHGCLVGLEASLEYFRRQRVDLLVCAGDVASFGPKPNECVELLIEHDVRTVKGNSDAVLVGEAPPFSVSSRDPRLRQIAEIEAWGREALAPSSTRWLQGLPDKVTVEPGLVIVHAGLEDLRVIVDRPENVAVPSGVQAVIAGHLHTPFIRQTSWGLWVNAGSAGRPCDGDPRASVALLVRGASGWTAHLERVPFDLERAAHDILTSGVPYADKLVKTQVDACWW